MDDNFFKKVIRPRINNILAISDYMKADIERRHNLSYQNDDNASPFEVVLCEDYSFGWKEVIEYTMKYTTVDGFIFTGEDGCGKHTATEIVCSRLNDNDIVFLSGENFLFTEAEIQADSSNRQKNIEKNDFDSYTDDIIHSFFECLFGELDSESNICIVIDNTKYQSNMELVYRRIEKYLYIYSQNDNLPMLFIVIIEKNIDIIPSALRKRLRCMHMSYPNQNQRLKMIKGMGMDTEISEIIAKLTEGSSYAQLRDLVQNLLVHERVFDLSYDFYQNFIDAQNSVIYHNEKINLIAKKNKLYSRLEELIEMLPQVLEKMLTVSYLPSSIESKISVNEEVEESYEEDLWEQSNQLELQKKQVSSKIEKETADMTLGDILNKSLGSRLEGVKFKNHT